MPFSLFLLLALFHLSSGNIPELIQKFDKVSDFTIQHYREINFDGLIGFAIAEAQLRQIPKNKFTDRLISKCEVIRKKIAPILPRTPEKMIILEEYLLKPQNWMISGFKRNSLKDFGVYGNWTREFILGDHKATYKGVSSDFCLMEILRDNCHVGSFCNEMMLAPRIDRGYLLTHRLFYLQIARMKNCLVDEKKFKGLIENFCSLILREARTSEILGYPATDIFLEQIVLCGIEGFAEFLREDWRTKAIEWQTSFGCYRFYNFEKRSTNVISYECADHTTGLGAAALALALKYEISQLL